ncbi:imidazole glycerol phosphate synthase subunit HisH [Bifidobacterium sp. BRDM6]|uniref:Imidazole glycerol phosphate synthase subunit HisH n=1 Tax=Bifidobacterium choloepi TaxID=2614131 RepID=A0A6I5N2Z5_9BIFI|nr:imidazole glycerol phosphate synthase subunit HisH [Bifidobacterium choloepi]NEG70029.1 imidazole glycerol phosphate synthase subunit HisH [Bifidobacterium choloepi]
MTAVTVFDYGFGNVRSMVRALANLGLDVTLTSDYRTSLEADGLVVPGVGAFGACMTGLKAVGGDRVILDRLRAGRPVLGVCVGQQIMFDAGHEHGVETAGLGLIGGDVVRLDAPVVPHMGWDTVDAPEGSVLLRGVEDERFYFVHSYAAADVVPKAAIDYDGSSFELAPLPTVNDAHDGPAPEKVTWCTYGNSTFVAAYERGPLFATQFHPEKSARAGAKLLQNWVDVL